MTAPSEETQGGGGRGIPDGAPRTCRGTKSWEARMWLWLCRGGLVQLQHGESQREGPDAKSPLWPLEGVHSV